MELVEIDPIRAEPAQTALDCLPHVAGRGTAGTVLTQGTPELGPDHHLLAVPAQRPAQPLLTLQVRVGRVEKVDPRREGGVDHWWNLVLLHAEAEVVGSETHDRHLERSDPSHVHARCLPRVFSLARRPQLSLIHISEPTRQAEISY